MTAMRVLSGPVPDEEGGGRHGFDARPESGAVGFGGGAVLVPRNGLAARVNRSRKDRLRALLAADAQLDEHGFIRRVLKLDGRLADRRGEIGLIEVVRLRLAPPPEEGVRFRQEVGRDRDGLAAVEVDVGQVARGRPQD